MPRKLRYERLEERTVQAGNITAELRGDTLFLSGDRLDNHVQIDGNATSLIVRGEDDSADIDTTVNGKLSVTFYGVRNVQFAMLAGDDAIHVGSNSFTSLTTIIGTTGAGNDVFSLSSIFGTQVSVANIGMGAGSDSLGMFSAQVGVVIARMGLGDDSAIFQNTTISGPLLLNGGVGDDRVVFRNLTTLTAVVWLGDGNNSVQIDGWQTRAGGTLIGGSGRDVVIANDVTATGVLTVVLGAGDDSLTIRRAKLGSAVAIALGGVGRDTLSVQYVIPPLAFVPVEFEA